MWATPRERSLAILLPSRIAHEGVGKPIGCDDRHVLGKRLDLSRRRLHGPRVDQPPHDRPCNLGLVIEDFLEVFLDRMMPRKKLVQIAVKEAIFENRLEHQMQEKPHVLGVRRMRIRRRERSCDVAAEVAK